MALIEIKADPGLLKELIEVLRRIAAGFERAYPPRPDPATLKNRKPHGPEDLIEFHPEEEWERQQEEEARQS